MRAICSGGVQDPMVIGRFKTKRSSNRFEMNMVDSRELSATELRAFHSVQ